MTRKKIILCIFFGLQVVLLSGCPSDVLSSPPSKVEGSSNTSTIRPMTFTQSENVTRVVVVTRNTDSESRGEIQWEVVAERPVPSRGFRVTVGKCPIGFKQIVPDKDQSFTPLKGRTYSIEVFTNAANVYPVDTEWIAE